MGAIVLALEQDGVDVASMRAVIVADPQTIVSHLDAPWPSALSFEGPVMVLERAATRPEFRRLGLNSLLRYCFIKMAVAEGVPYVAGTVYQSASRIELMQAMGYRFHPIEDDRDQWLVETQSPRLIATLDLARDGQRALEVLTLKLEHDQLVVRR